MRLKEFWEEYAYAIIITLLVIGCAVLAVGSSLSSRKEQQQRHRAMPPPQVSIQEPEAVLLASPIWMDEQSRFARGGTVYLIDVKGHKLAVVISDRGAGICELRENLESEKHE